MLAEPRRYLLAGEPVTVVVSPNQRRTNRPPQRFPLPRISDYAPVNVAVRFQDGTVLVCPRRRLRRAHG
ncbi:hypothetical protein [Streptosporangium sp. G12]